MTLDFFKTAYDFDSFTIDYIEVNNDKLTIYAQINAHLDLIANGYRPELDFSVGQVFTFTVKPFGFKLEKPYSIDIDDKYLIVNGNRIEITADTLDVKKYYKE